MKIIFLSFFLAILTVTAPGQVDVTLAGADLQCVGDDQEVNVTFSKSLSGMLLDAYEGSTDSPPKKNRLDELEASIKALSPGGNTSMSGIFLLDQAGNRIGLISDVQIATRNGLGVDGNYDVPDTISYHTASGVVPTKKYVVAITSLAKTPSIVALVISPNCMKPPDALPAPTYKAPVVPQKSFNEKFAAATGKDDAMVFGEISYESRRKNNPEDKNTHSFTGSASFVPIRINRIGFGGSVEFQPFFYDLKINDKGKANSYISNMGLKLRYMRVFADDGDGYSTEDNSRTFPGLVFDTSAKLEMNDFFDGMNVGFDVQPTLPINLYQSRARMFRLDPFVGFTLARNVKASKRTETEVPRSELLRLKWILRPMTGFKLTYSEFRDRVIKPTLTLDYQIRWPLKAEDIYSKSPGSDNDDVYIGQSRLPRNYWKAKLEFDIGSILSPFLMYESGRLPPDYKLISGQFKFGFSLKFVRKP